jgi:hypothetical protein
MTFVRQHRRTPDSHYTTPFREIPTYGGLRADPDLLLPPLAPPRGLWNARVVRAGAGQSDLVRPLLFGVPASVGAAAASQGDRPEGFGVLRDLERSRVLRILADALLGTNSR